MDIASLVIRARPADAQRVGARLTELPGVEIASFAGHGVMAVTVEDRPGASFEQTLLDIHQVEGVISATLVYQHSEP